MRRSCVVDTFSCRRKDDISCGSAESNLEHAALRQYRVLQANGGFTLNDHGNHVGASATPSQITPQRIMEMAWGYAPPLIIEAAVRNRIFDVLDGGPKTIEQISADTGTSARGVRAIVQALVGFRLLSANANVYSLTPESSAFLVSSKPGFQGGIFRHVSTQLLPNWMHLSDVVRSGKPAERVNEIDEGCGVLQGTREGHFPHELSEREAVGRVADNAPVDGNRPGTRYCRRLRGLGNRHCTALAKRAGNCSRLAGGHAHNAGGREEARRRRPRTRHIGRYSASGPRERLPAGDPRSHSAQRRTREIQVSPAACLRCALGPGGSIAIAEFVVNADRNGPPNALIFAVNMLVNTGAGDTYSFEEMNGWLKEAGFINMRQLEAPGPSPLLLADKPT